MATGFRITIDLPAPDSENVEQELADQFTHMVSTCRGMLEQYKKLGHKVPVLSVKTNQPKKVKEPSEKDVFVRTLLAYHMERVPTANAPQQVSALRGIYETGHTDAEQIKALYEENLAKRPTTSWTTIRWLLGQPDAKEKASELTFQRETLSEDRIQSLAARLKKTVAS